MNKKLAFIIHGWSTETRNIQPVIDYFEKQEDTDTYVVKLLGHFEHNEELFVKYSWQDWLNQCDAEFRVASKNYKKEDITLIGFSMGALLVSNLSIDYGVNNLILLAPAFHITNKLIWLTPIAKIFIKKIKWKGTITWIEPSYDLLKVNLFTKKHLKKKKFIGKNILSIVCEDDEVVSYDGMNFVKNNSKNCNFNNNIISGGSHEMFLIGGKLITDKVLNMIEKWR